MTSQISSIEQCCVVKIIKYQSQQIGWRPLDKEKKASWVKINTKKARKMKENTFAVNCVSRFIISFTEISIWMVCTRQIYTNFKKH